MQTVEVPMEALIQVIRLQLETAGQSDLTVTGCSMLPMLRQYRDSVRLVPVDGKLKPGDIALFQRDDGSYVLHRVISLTADGYRFCGDNQAVLEEVSHGQLVARAAGYTKKGKVRTMNGLGYRLYRWSRVKLFFTRKYDIAIRRRLGRLRRKLFK